MKHSLSILFHIFIGNIYVFPVSNLLYFQPTSTMNTGSQTLTVINLIAPGYTISNTITVNGWSLVSKKVTDQFTFPVILNVAQCTSFTSFIQTASNYYSSQNNVTLWFNFITGIYLFLQ